MIFTACGPGGTCLENVSLGSGHAASALSFTANILSLRGTSMGPECDEKRNEREERYRRGRVRRLEIGVSLGASLCGGAEQSLVRETSQKALAKNLRTFSGDCTTRDDLE
jgi:hypothetical protein